MKKLSLIAVLSVLLTLSFVGPAFAADDDEAEQNVTVKASYSLSRIGGGSNTTVEFANEADYSNGYAQTNNAIELKVVAPGSWDVEAKVTNDGSGQSIINAFHAKAEGNSLTANWVDLNNSGKTIRTGGIGVTKFNVHYRVLASQLSAGGDDVEETVKVTYSFI